MQDYEQIKIIFGFNYRLQRYSKCTIVAGIKLIEVNY